MSPELGPSTSGTGSFQNLTGLPEGTNVRKRKSHEVSIQQTIATTTQHSSKIAAKRFMSGFVTPRTRVRKARKKARCQERLCITYNVCDIYTTLYTTYTLHIHYIYAMYYGVLR